jgi:hypothetical protein
MDTTLALPWEYLTEQTAKTETFICHAGQASMGGNPAFAHPQRVSAF